MRGTRWQPCTPLSFFFSSRRRHTSSYGDWSSDVCSSELGYKLLARHVLEQEPARTRLHRLVDVLVEVEGCQDEHARVASCLGEPPGRLDAVEPGHADVHQHDVRT